LTDLTPAVATGGDGATARRTLRAGIEERLWAGAWAASALALLVTASSLHPARAGFGTHEQLGLPPCVWMATFGKPCPTCGMTTSFTFAAHGWYWRSFVTQPFGAALVLATVTTFWIALHTATTGSRALTMTLRAVGAKGVWLGVIGLLAAWIYKLLEVAG
jgi:hypothetical protein